MGLLLAFLAGLGTGCWLPARLEPDIRVSEPRTGVYCSGVVDVEPGVINLCPAQPGRVAEVVVQEGEHVARGAVLLRTDSQSARNRVDEAKASLTAAQVQLVQARLVARRKEIRISQQSAAIDAVSQRLAGAREALARKQEMVKSQLLNAREAVIAEHQVKEAEALYRAECDKLAELKLQDPGLEVQQAEAQVSLATARLQQACQFVEDCQLEAPVAGTVMRVLTAKGELAGGPTRPPALAFCPDGPWVVRAEVEQEFAGRLLVGQDAVVEDDTPFARPWRGKVVRIAPWYTQRRPVGGEPARFHDVQSVECLIVLSEQALPVRIGQRVKVTIQCPIQ